MIDDFSLDHEFDAEIDLTPLVDTIFILLIFFFLTTTFLRPALPVNLAKAASAAAADERREQMVLTIDAAGGLFYAGAPLARADIPALLRAHPEQGINLFVDRDAPFEAFLAVVDEARLQHRDDLSITVRPEDRE